MKILVCGARKTTPEQEKAIRHELDRRKPDIDAIIQGGAYGVDRAARDWARREGVCCITVDAAWSAYGKRAGPMRNKWMLQHCSPDLVLAFPGGTGTASMKLLATMDGVHVEEAKW